MTLFYNHRPFHRSGLRTLSRFAIISCLIVFFSAEQLMAQSYSLRHYAISEGMNSTVVYRCLQDSRGYMWFATDAGLCRFDGKKFDQFTTRDGLSGNEIFNLFEDSKKRLWFLTYNGHLSYYKEGVFYNEKKLPLLRKMYLGQSYTSAFEDSKGNIYFGSYGTKFIVLTNENVIVYDYPLSYGAFDFKESKNGEILVSSRYNRKKIVGNILVDEPLKYNRKDVKYVESMPGNNFYFSDSGLVQISDGNEHIIIRYAQLPDYEYINGCLENKDSIIIISTRTEGALFYKRKGAVYVKEEEVLKDEIILSTFVDNESNTWFNTEGNGIYMMSDANKRMKNITVADGLESASIYRIIKGYDESLWLACGMGKIANIRNKTIINYQLTNLAKNRSKRVLDLVFDKNDYLWCATDDGIFAVKNKKQIVNVPLYFEGIVNQLSGKTISCDLENNIFVSYSFGVAKLHRSLNNEFKFYQEPITNSFQTRTFTHLIDHANRFWIANINGLNLWDGKQLICYGDSDELLKSRILQIIEIGDTLVLSTNDRGIVFFSKNKVIKTFTEKDGLSSDICRKICYSNNKLWISTCKGLTTVEFNQGNFQNIQVFNESDGLASDDVEDVLDDGKLVYIATGNGLTILNKSIPVRFIKPPVVYVTSVLVNDREVNKNNLTALKYTESSIIINFIAITFQNSDKVIYQYNLNSEKSEWNTTRNNTIEFSSLSPGQYTFSLRAKKDNSDWSSPVTINFKINPPFWRTVWFWIILSLLILAGLIYIIRYLTRKRAQKQIAELSRRELLLNERSRISSDMHDDLGADLSRIVVLSEVMKVTDQIDQKTLANIDKISQYAIDLRTKIDEIIWALNPRHDSLSALLSYTHRYILDYLEDSNLKVDLKINPSVPEMQVSAAFRRNVFLIVKEAIHNCVSHASASKARIAIEVNDKTMSVTIEDDGKGFEQKSINSGNGLENMRKRTKEIGGKIKIVSAPGSGCNIKLWCPLVKLKEA